MIVVKKKDPVGGRGRWQYEVDTLLLGKYRSDVLSDNDDAYFWDPQCSSIKDIGCAALSFLSCVKNEHYIIVPDLVWRSFNEFTTIAEWYRKKQIHKNELTERQKLFHYENNEYTIEYPKVLLLSNRCQLKFGQQIVPDSPLLLHYDIQSEELTEGEEWRFFNYCILQTSMRKLKTQDSHSIVERLQSEEFNPEFAYEQNNNRDLTIKIHCHDGNVDIFTKLLSSSVKRLLGTLGDQAGLDTFFVPDSLGIRLFINAFRTCCNKTGSCLTISTKYRHCPIYNEWRNLPIPNDKNHCSYDKCLPKQEHNSQKQNTSPPEYTRISRDNTYVSNSLSDVFEQCFHQFKTESRAKKQTVQETQESKFENIKQYLSVINKVCLPYLQAFSFFLLICFPLRWLYVWSHKNGVISFLILIICFSWALSSSLILDISFILTFLLSIGLYVLMIQ